MLAAASSLMILACLPVSGAQAMALEEAVDIALSQHPSILAAIANRDAVRSDHETQESGLWPQLNVQASAGRVYADTATTRGLTVDRGAGYSWMGEGSVTLSQLIFDGMETRRRIRAADSRRESADFNVLDVREELALRAVLAYLDLLRAEEAVADIAAYHRIATEYLDTISGMVAQGGAEESTRMHAEDIYAQLQRTRIDTEAQRDQARADFVEIVGMMPPEPLSHPVTTAEFMPVDLDDAIMQAVRNHPALLAASAQAESFHHDALAQHSTLMPDISGELSYFRREQREIIGGNIDDGRALVRLNWDYSFGGAERARIREAQYRYAESRAQREQRRLAVELGVKRAHSNLDAARQQLDVLDERLRLNEQLVENNRIQFEGGRLNILQLMQAENALFGAQMARKHGSFRLLATQYAYLASIGRLQDSLGVAPAGK